MRIRTFVPLDVKVDATEKVLGEEVVGDVSVERPGGRERRRSQTAKEKTSSECERRSWLSM